MKPIFTVGLSREIGIEKILQVTKNLELKMPDYHVLTYLHDELNTKFQVFYEKDFSEIEFEDLKSLVMKNLYELESRNK